MHPQFRGGEVMYRNVVRPAYRAVHSSLKSAQSGTHASTAGYRTSVPASATSATSTSFERGCQRGRGRIELMVARADEKTL